MSSQRLTKVDTNLKPSVINHKNVSKPGMKPHKCKYIGIQLMNTKSHIYKLDACVCTCMSM